MLTRKESEGLISHEIWFSFQQKFTRVGELGKFIPFFQYLMKEALESMIAQNIFIVEYRHISGMLFDENKKGVSVIDELKIMSDAVEEIKKKCPYF